LIDCVIIYGREMKPMREAALMERLRQQDQDALDQLTTRYRSYVCTILSNMLQGTGCYADVEELCSDVFLALWQHVEEVEDGKIKPWLGTVARNRAKSWLRARQELPMDIDEIELPDDGPGLEDEAIRAELAAAVRKAVDSLKPKDRDIFLRYYFYLQPVEEIAAALHMAPVSVRSRLSRGREVLRKRLEKEVRA
jgi:RNA polymerase sigma-70 factor (ECF subfamily)